jgi:hypothetical protein
MLASTRRALFFRIAAAAATGVAFAASAMADVVVYDRSGSLIESASAWLGAAWRRLVEWVEIGYVRRPAVMLGLAAAFALPVLALLGLLLHRRSPPHCADDMGRPTESPCIVAARILIDGGDPIALPDRPLVQIGRQDDNDICIAKTGVEHYHAVIERSGATGFTITDVSGAAGGGLRVNGEPRKRAALTDGDTLELGEARLRFAVAA